MKMDKGFIKITTHHLHPKPTKTLANATFKKTYANAKNGSALGVKVNAIVQLFYS